MNSDYDHIKDYISKCINNDVRMLISDFAVLWNNYEKYLFSDNEGNPFYSFSKLKNDVANKVFLNINENYEVKILELYDAFEKYLNNKQYDLNFSNFLNHFHVRKSDITENELLEMFNDLNVKNKYLILMLMVGRVRNNMFHGIKKMSSLNDQRELFRICNELLTLSLNITRTLIFV